MLGLLLACAPPTIPFGRTTAEYDLRSWEGEPMGEIRLGQIGPEPVWPGEREGDRVEHLRAALGERTRYQLDARLSAEGGWEAVVRRDARWERHALSLEALSEHDGGTSWSRWRGLARLGGPLATPPLALAEGFTEDALPGPANSLLA